MVAPTCGYARGYKDTQHLKEQLAWLKTKGVPEEAIFVTTSQDLSKVSQDETFDNLLSKIASTAGVLYLYNLLDLSSFEELPERVERLGELGVTLVLKEPPVWLTDEVTLTPAALLASSTFLLKLLLCLREKGTLERRVHEERAQAKSSRGRRPSLSNEQADELVAKRRAGATIPELMEIFAVSKSTVQKYWRNGR